MRLDWWAITGVMGVLGVVRGRLRGACGFVCELGTVSQGLVYGYTGCEMCCDLIQVKGRQPYKLD